jgi:hypothetical protein
MKCVLCRQRKGRRSCPAKGEVICPQCCGAKRMLEIDCPESCEYLKSGRSHEASLAGARHYRASQPLEQEKNARVLANFEPVILQLQYQIAVERRAVRDLKDADVAEALDCLLKTLRTEERGIIYETTSGNLRAESLRRQFSMTIESFRYPKESDAVRVLLADAIACLEVLRAMVASHLTAGPSSLSFVDFLARHLPRNAMIEPPAPSIIIPGR